MIWERAQARELDQQAGVSVTYVQATADSTGLEADTADVVAAGLAGIETFSYDMHVPYTPEAWRGRIRASAGIVNLDSAAVRNFDEALAALLAHRFPSAVLEVPHRIFAIIASA